MNRVTVTETTNGYFFEWHGLRSIPTHDPVNLAAQIEAVTSLDASYRFLSVENENDISEQQLFFHLDVGAERLRIRELVSGPAYDPLEFFC